MTGAGSGLVGRALGVLLPAAFAAAFGAGCGTSTVMTAPTVATPILLGPVACIGCAPSPAPPPLGPTVTDSSGASYTGISGANFFSWHIEKAPPTLDQSVSRMAGDPCHLDVRVSRLRAGAFGLFALFVTRTSVSVDVESAPVVAPNGSCWARPSAPVPGALPP